MIGKSANTATSPKNRGPLLLLEGDSLDKKPKNKNRKRKDFLGNTRTDHIVGLFKRTEVITGDKKSAKQLKRDKKFKEGKKKRVKRTKKKTLNVF